LDVHPRIERWALDEVLLPGKLVNQILQWLYREDRFCHGILTVLDRTVGPASIEIPMLAIVNVADEIAPLTSVAPFIDKMPVKDTRIVELPNEIGVCLPHLGTLVGRTPYALPGAAPSVRCRCRSSEFSRSGLYRRTAVAAVSVIASGSQHRVMNAISYLIVPSHRCRSNRDDRLALRCTTRYQICDSFPSAANAMIAVAALTASCSTR
jgi:hypothetical protein